MANRILDTVAEDLFSTLPLIGRSIRRKLLKTALTGFNEDIAPPHFEIMKLLDEAGTLHVAEIGERLQIARPQMTHLTDKLVELNIVERQMSMADRRMKVFVILPAKKVLSFLAGAALLSLFYVFQRAYVAHPFILSWCLMFFLFSGLLLFAKGAWGSRVKLDAPTSEDNEAGARGIPTPEENLPFVIMDLTGSEVCIADFSPGAEEMFGYRRDEVVGMPVTALCR